MAAFYERAYNERDKTESGSFAQEYVEPLPRRRAEPRHRLRIQARAAAAAGHHGARSHRRWRKSLLADDSRVILATSPQKPDVTGADRSRAAGSAGRGERDARSRPWTDTTVDARADGEEAGAGADRVARERSTTLGVTIVKFGNGVEAWLKPTDFKNDQVLFSLQAQGGTSLAPPADYRRSVARRPRYVSALGRRRFEGARPAEAAGRASSPRRRRSSRCRRTAFPDRAAPAQLETALQLLYAAIHAAGRRSGGVRADEAPARGVGRQPRPDARTASSARSSTRSTPSNHYTSQPLTPERVDALDRAKMLAFYRQRFANAADFTFFMVGAFKIDEALPLLRATSASAAVRPASSIVDLQGRRASISRKRASRRRSRRAASRAARRSSASSPTRPDRSDRAGAASSRRPTCSRSRCATSCARSSARPTRCRSACRSRCRSAAAATSRCSFGAAPENIETMTARVMQEIKRLQNGRAVAGSDQPREGNRAAQLRDRAEAERLLAGPPAVGAACSAAIRTRS